MKISIDALSLCARKYNKGELLGVRIPEFDPNLFSSEIDAKQLGNELICSEMIEESDEGFRVSPLGQHIINMMATPEIMIKIDNTALNISLTVYLRDAYYLCCIKRNDEKDENKIFLKLLPDIKKVVESCIFALKCENKSKWLELCLRDEKPNTIKVYGYSWNKDRTISSQKCMAADYTECGVVYTICDDSNNDCSFELQKCDLCDFVNLLTQWMLDRIAENYLREDKGDVRYVNQSQ